MTVINFEGQGDNQRGKEAPLHGIQELYRIEMVQWLGYKDIEETELMKMPPLQMEKYAEAEQATAQKSSFTLSVYGLGASVRCFDLEDDDAKRIIRDGITDEELHSLLYDEGWGQRGPSQCFYDIRLVT
jgi:hypothetical protein